MTYIYSNEYKYLSLRVACPETEFINSDLITTVLQYWISIIKHLSNTTSERKAVNQLCIRTITCSGATYDTNKLLLQAKAPTQIL